MSNTIIDQDFPYDIIHRGSRDAARHNRRVKEAAKKQLKDIISQQDIITSEGNKKVKVRLKYLDQYRFVYNKDYHEVVGRDQFDELEVGEVLDKPSQGQGAGPKAGEEAGEELYETEFTVEELTDMMIEELQLPDLDETKKNEIVSEILEWTDRRKKTGVEACLDKKKTLLSHLVRRAKLGIKPDKPLAMSKDDMVYRTWDIAQEKHSNAVVFLMMDRSGSMWQDKIYAVKALFFWVVQFLKRKYDKVDIRFIAHDYNAKELNEKDFFTISDSGGTRVSSAYGMCANIIQQEYPCDIWNIYCFHASDGDSYNDEKLCMDLVNEILDLGANLFAYTEINIDNWRGDDTPSVLYEYFSEQVKRRDGVILSILNELDDIMDVLSAFLKKKQEHQKV